MGGQVSASGGGFDPQVDPGPVNAPAIFEPSSALTGGAAQVWVSASGGANWGGALVSISFDGTNFSNIGYLTAPAYQGVLTADLPNHSDPDTVDTLAIDLTESAGVLPTAATGNDANAFRTLVWICPVFSTAAPNAGELVAYGAVSATGTYTSNLTYLRRGLYGTTPADHPTGSFFNRIDLGSIDTPPNSVLTCDLPAQYIGASLYLKFQSFNVFGNALEDIATVAEYSYTPSGAGYGGGTAGTPTTPTGLSASGGQNAVTLAWNANSATDNVTGYRIFRAAGTGASFGSATEIAQVNALNYADTGLPNATGYTYFLDAVNAVGASSPTSGANATTNTATTTTGRRVSTTGGTLSLTNADSYVDVTNTTAALTIALPTAILVTGQRIVITDEGATAGTWNWTLQNGLTVIDTLTVSSGYIAVRWNGTNWLRTV